MLTDAFAKCSEAVAKRTDAFATLTECFAMLTDAFAVEHITIVFMSMSIVVVTDWIF